MRLARIATIALLVIIVASTVACTSTPAVTCLSCEEAIALAQDEWNDAVQQVPCTDGRTYMVNHLSSYHWTCDYQYEPDYILVKYVPAGSAQHIDSNAFYTVNLNDLQVAWFKWRVYCDSHIVSADGETWNHLQTAITEISTYYCD